MCYFKEDVFVEKFLGAVCLDAPLVGTTHKVFKKI